MLTRVDTWVVKKPRKRGTNSRSNFPEVRDKTIRAKFLIGKLYCTSPICRRIASWWLSFDHSSPTIWLSNHTSNEIILWLAKRRRPRSGVTDNIDDDVDEDKERIDDDDDDEDNGEPTKCRRRFFIFASIDDSDNANTRSRLVHVYISNICIKR